MCIRDRLYTCIILPAIKPLSDRLANRSSPEGFQDGSWGRSSLSRRTEPTPRSGWDPGSLVCEDHQHRLAECLQKVRRIEQSKTDQPYEDRQVCVDRTYPNSQILCKSGRPHPGCYLASETQLCHALA